MKEISAGLHPASSSQQGQLKRRWGCSELHPVRFLTSSGTETAQTPWETCSNASLNLLVKDWEESIHWHFRGSESFTTCSGVGLVRENILWKMEAKKRPKKGLELEVAQNQWQWVLSLWIWKKDQICFLWTPTSIAWCPKFIVCHCSTVMKIPLAPAYKRK